MGLEERRGEVVMERRKIDFVEMSPPARTTFAVKALPKGGVVEIEFVAIAQR